MTCQFGEFRKLAALLRSLICVSVLAAIIAFSACSSSSSPSASSPPGNSNGNLTQISSDSYTSAPAQHATEVEPHMLANGNMLVAAFQVGRFPASPGPGGGSTDIGWATSTDGGTTWSHGFLPGLTTGEGTGPYEAASDPVVAYDAKHQVWMISSLPVSSQTTPAVLISRSTDGMTWSSPVNVADGFNDSDKNWTVCDSWSSSPYYGNCYTEFDAPDPGQNDLIYMSTSSDGGLTWSTPVTTANGDHGIGGQPLVQPSGTVVVPILGFPGPVDEISAFTSTNGGASWGGMESIVQVQSHTENGGLRSGPLPSAAVDGAGNVWIVWEDCRFRTSCASNDLVYVTSPDGVNWSAVTRVPIDAVTTSVDYFIPGISIDPATSGSGAHVAIHYYFYSQSDCTVSSCQLNVGFISSSNGGTGWNSPTALAGPMQLGWLPNSQNGLMVGDYVATAFTSGVPHGVFAVAAANSGTTFSEAMYTAQGLSVTAQGRQLSSAHDKPLHKLSDPIENEVPEKGIKPPARKARRRAK